MRKILVFLLVSVLVVVMVSVAAALPIPVANWNFNDPPGSGAGGWEAVTPVSWDSLGFVGVFNPTIWEPGLGSYVVYDSSDVALVYGETVLGQWVGASVIDGMTYTLAVDAAGRIGLTGNATYQLALVAGNPDDLTDWITLAKSDFFTPMKGVFNEGELIYTASSLDFTHTKLGINILAGASTTTDKQLLFDNVRLDATTSVPVPEPASMLLLGSGLIGLAGFGRKKLFKK